MLSGSFKLGLVVAGCLTAAAGGAFVAVRQNAASAAATSVVSPQAPVTTPAGPQPVTETEAVVGTPASPANDKKPDEKIERATPPAAPVEPAPRPAPAAERRSVPVRATAPQAAPALERDDRAAEVATPASVPAPNAPAAVAPPADPAPRVEAPPAPAQPQFEEVVLPAASVIGLEIETSVSSERARVEDRVDARVTRDVYVDGRLLIPSHSRMVGAVTLVERGGKVKERARLGVRFHTLVLDDGRQIAIRTETIMREGESPSGESSRKIGGAAIGGAVLGAIMGGGKGAVLGGAAGAAGGTAAVMAGGRNAAMLNEGTIVTARLATPVAIEVEKR